MTAIPSLSQNQTTQEYFWASDQSVDNLIYEEATLTPEIDIIYAFGASKDARNDRSSAEDYLTWFYSNDVVYYAICDGVSQSFGSHVAAKVVGDTLIDVLAKNINDLPYQLVDKVYSALGQQQLSYQVRSKLNQLTNPYPTNTVKYGLFEGERKNGSEVKWVCGYVDLNQQRWVSLMLGDVQFGRYKAEGQKTQWKNSDSQACWSSNKGTLGEIKVHEGQLFPLETFIVCSDGILKEEGQSFVQTRNAQILDHVFEKGRDDLSLIIIRCNINSKPLSSDDTPRPSKKPNLFPNPSLALLTISVILAVIRGVQELIPPLQTPTPPPLPTLPTTSHPPMPPLPATLPATSPPTTPTSSATKPSPQATNTPLPATPRSPDNMTTFHIFKITSTENIHVRLKPDEKSHAMGLTSKDNKHLIIGTPSNGWTNIWHKYSQPNVWVAGWIKSDSGSNEMVSRSINLQTPKIQLSESDQIYSISNDQVVKQAGEYYVIGRSSDKQWINVISIPNGEANGWVKTPPKHTLNFDSIEILISPP